MKKNTIILLSALLIFAACKQSTKPQSSSTTEKNTVVETPKAEDFQKEVDGKQVNLYTLKNKNGVEVKITNYGCRIVSVLTPDKNGNFADIALGFNTIDGYLKDKDYLGCIAGRFANRIGKGTFKLEGDTYSLYLNDGPNTLHGGESGLDKKVWDAKQEGNKLELTYTSPDMEEGYPGNLTMKLVYALNDNNELSMDYEATTDKTTVLNLTNHTYYNLKGDGTKTILDHKMQIFADKTTPVDSTLIPTGEIVPVEGTPLDFREGKTIGQDIKADNQQIAFGGGYDHNWILNKEEAGALTLGLRMSEPTTGRVLEIYTTEPAMQFYSGNFLDGTLEGKYGQQYQYRCAVVLEPQHYPDSPNHDNFPSTVLKPGETYTQKSVVKFSVEE